MTKYDALVRLKEAGLPVSMAALLQARQLDSLESFIENPPQLIVDALIADLDPDA